MFSWKPIYMELAKALMAYRDRQGELLEWLAELKAEGIPVIKLDDENPKDISVPLAEIDPFSFFANFNRGIKEEYRRRILEFLKGKMGLNAPLPDDFDGLPVVNLQKALFFPYAYDREDGDVPALWDLAKEIISKTPDSLNDEIFTRCLDIRQVGPAKLTIGMFWLRPDSYLAMDALTLDYVREKGVLSEKIDSLAEYRAFLSKVQSSVGDDYPALSREAYLFANKLPVSAERIADGFKGLMEAQAAKNNMTVQDVALHLARTPELGQKENEVLNRHRVFPKLREVLMQEPVDIHALKRALSDLWATKQGFDAARLGNFLKYSAAPQAIRDLLDDRGGIDEIARVDAFIDEATANGYAKPNGRPDAPGAAQFASVLLSAVSPERFVDFKDSRWNTLFTLVTDPGKRLCSGQSYGWKLVRAGKFATALASSPVFQKLFGRDHGTWTAAGLAWNFKGGVFAMNMTSNVIPGDKEPLVVKHPLNMILYGPPGTGKTYQTIRRAVEIIDGTSSADDEEVKKRFDQLMDQSRIGFVTFHQSYSYEDFVEGIRPVMDDEGPTGVPRYECRDGIFKTMCAIARSDAGGTGAVADADWANLRIWKMSLGYTLDPDEAHIYDDCIDGGYIAHGAGQGLDFTNAKTPDDIRKALEKKDWSKLDGALSHNVRQIQSIRLDMRKGDIVIVTHGNHRFRAIGRVTGDYRFDPSSEYQQTRPVKWLRVFDEPQPKDRLLRGKAFSQLTLYPLFEADIKMDALREMLSVQEKTDARKYVLIIDEINRGNISKILGELITLIEPDKRRGQRYALTVTLPYSQKPFIVPDNLYILGTMNTADKSIALVDVALRRRFEFKELTPDFSVCTKLTPVMRKVLDELNRRILVRKDRDHQIGHAYFIEVGDVPGFNGVFANQIIPLLQEYFYNDWEGVRYVLGESGPNSGAFIRAVGDGDRKWARTLWQWNTGLGKDTILEQLAKNYGGGATEDDQTGQSSN
jgi:hypothetical protein